MRKITLYLFLFTYTMAMFKPVMPYVTDLAAHLLFYQEHMLTVHAHHGKFHVHAAVTEGAKNDQSDKNSNNLKKDNAVSDHIVNQCGQETIKKFSLKYYSLFKIHPTDNSTDHNYPPPKV